MAIKLTALFLIDVVLFLSIKSMILKFLIIKLSGGFGALVGFDITEPNSKLQTKITFTKSNIFLRLTLLFFGGRLENVH